MHSPIYACRFPSLVRRVLPLTVLLLSCAAPLAAQPAGGPPPSPLRYGRIVVLPRITFSYSSNDGVQARPGQPTDTDQYTLSPGFLVKLGDRWSFDYGATYDRYSNGAFKNTVAHDARFSGGLSGPDWSANVSQSYTTTESTMFETGRQTARENVGTSFGYSHTFTPELSYQVNGSQNLSFVEAFSDSYTWGVSQSLVYQVSAQTSVDASLKTNYSAVLKSADMLSVQPFLSLNWKPSAKVTLAVNGGIEHRELLSEAGGDMNNPVYGSSITYKPFEVTTLTASANQEINASLFSDQVSKSNGWSITLEQRLLEHFTFVATNSHQSTEYIEILPSNESVNRSDELEAYSFRLRTTFMQRGTVSLVYSRNRNASDTQGFGVSSREMGFQVGYSF